MTPKNQIHERKNANKVAVEAREINAGLMEQPDFLQPVVQEAVQTILEMERRNVCRQASTSARVTGKVIAVNPLALHLLSRGIHQSTLTLCCFRIQVLLPMLNW